MCIRDRIVTFEIQDSIEEDVKVILSKDVELPTIGVKVKEQVTTMAIPDTTVSDIQSDPSITGGVDVLTTLNQDCFSMNKAPCSTITCLKGTGIDYGNINSCCATGTCQNNGPDNDLCCNICEAGKYSLEDTVAGECIPCGLGKYSTDVNSQDESTCIQCVAGKYLDVLGSDKEEDCIVCPVGKLSLIHI